MRRSRSNSAIGIALVLIGFLAACSDDDTDTGSTTYLPQTSEDNVLENVIRSWEERDVAAYAKLLAADYQFYSDPTTRTQLGIEFWTRTTDSLSAEAIFNCPAVKSIEVDIDWVRGSARDPGFLDPRREWTRIDITSLSVEVVIQEPGEAPVTYRCDRHPQAALFRRGSRFPAAQTDDLVYLVEWRDEAPEAEMPPMTWTRIKASKGECGSKR